MKILNKSIERAKTPESVGIDSSVISKMTEEMSYRGISIHSLMILRENKVACEAWSKPLAPDMPHMVYSISKSFLATAYGFALSEGKITREKITLNSIKKFQTSSMEEDNFDILKSYIVVTNLSNDEMLFNLGLHPAFKVPLFDNEKFEDYRYLWIFITVYTVYSYCGICCKIKCFTRILYNICYIYFKYSF